MFKIQRTAPLTLFYCLGDKQSLSREPGDLAQVAARHTLPDARRQRNRISSHWGTEQMLASNEDLPLFFIFTVTDLFRIGFIGFNYLQSHGFIKFLFSPQFKFVCDPLQIGWAKLNVANVITLIQSPTYLRFLKLLLKYTEVHTIKTQTNLYFFHNVTSYLFLETKVFLLRYLYRIVILNTFYLSKPNKLKNVSKIIFVHTHTG